MAGTIGAATNNGLGVASINWVSKILPVRVLGKCGGYVRHHRRYPLVPVSVPGVPANVPGG
jgi:serine protease